MKATDFRPEHFENGRSFNKNDFIAYIQASENLAKTLYTKYLLCVGVGLLFSFLLSRAIGGFVGHLLALICIFSGLIVGGILNAKEAKKVNEIAARLGITKEDLVQARKHVKNGTVAWSDGGRFTLEEDDFLRTEITKPVLDKADTALAVSETPQRTVWAAGLFTAGWLLQVIFQVSFIRSLWFSSSALICLPSALLGASAYLVSRSDMKWRIIGGCFGLLSAILLTISIYVEYQVRGFRSGIDLFRFIHEPTFFRNFGSILLAVLLSMGAVLLFSILRKKTDKGQSWLCGLVGGSVYMLVRMFSIPWRIIGIMNSFHNQEIIVRQIIPPVTSAIVIILVCAGLNALCNMTKTQVKLRGVGLAWSWLALVGSIVSIILFLRVILMDPMSAAPLGMYAYNLIIGLSALIGYTLLLCKKRVGLYFILLGLGLILVSELIFIVTAGPVANGGSGRLLPTLISGLNPLFAWLAVRQGDGQLDGNTGTENRLNGFTPSGSVSYPEQVNRGMVSPSVTEEVDHEMTTESEEIKKYFEKDNLGTRQETMSQATAYWMGERIGLSVKPPFTMFRMPSAEAAESALLELPFIHKAEDTGKLICERLMTFGYYETTANGQLTGQYEAMITGNDLTRDEFEIAEKAFEKFGGTLKNHSEPDASVVAQTTEGDASLVRYSETVKGNDGFSTYEVYKGPDKASAVAFLKTKPVTRKYYYVVVDTPEGSFGKDINGFYQE